MRVAIAGPRAGRPPAQDSVGVAAVSTFLSTPTAQHALVDRDDAQDPRRRDDTRHPAPGRYTIVFADGHHRTLAVTVARPGFTSGPLVVCFLCGPDNAGDYRPFAHIDARGVARLWRRYREDATLAAALRVLMADPSAAADAYALESKRCARCRRPLTRPESVERGLGDECARQADLIGGAEPDGVDLAVSLRSIDRRLRRRRPR